MRNFHFSAPNFALALAALASLNAGCFGNDPLGLDGDWSQGERNNTQWQIGDGLCPGLTGGCALNVPLAVGVRTSFNVEGVHSAAPTVNTPGNTRDVTITANPDSQRVTINFTTAAPGNARFVISDERGEVDAATVQVRQPTRIECGLITNQSDPRWDIGDLTAVDAATVPFESATAVAQMNSLACRTSDAAGPLLSSDSISWQVVEGTSIELNDNFSSGATRGAHLSYTTLARGTAQISASFGELTDTLILTVE